VLACGPALQAEMVADLARCRPLSGASFGAPELDTTAP
jgi:myo-inositol-1(or 4)-monophosphatase